MAQAETHLTTRRGFSKWLGLLGTGALIAAPSAAFGKPVDPTLLGLSEALYSAFEAYHETVKAVVEAESNVEAWELENPRPGYDMDLEEKAPGSHGKAYSEWLLQLHAPHPVGKIKKARLEAYEFFEMAAEEFASYRAETWADLYHKADIARDVDTDVSTIATSLIYDLLELRQPNI